MDVFVNAKKEEIEAEIIRIEEKLAHLKKSLEIGKYLDYSKCKNCGSRGWVWSNPFTSAAHKCSCEYGKKRKPNAPEIQL